MLLPARFIRGCRRKLFRSKVADSSGADLTGGGLLMRTLILRRVLRREVYAREERFVGVLLPPSTGAVVVNAAITIDQRVAVNLNYTASGSVLTSCIRQGRVKHVLTSRRVMEKLDQKIDAELIFLDDLAPKIGWLDKFTAALGAYLLPGFVLERLLGLHKVKPDDLMTLIFTSGSTGDPKGVQLSHRNVLFNTDAIQQLIRVKADDVLIGVLPFFHSFGYSVLLWAVLGTDDFKGAYHFTPLDARQVGKLTSQHRGTILLCTATFLRGYLRRCTPEEFKSLDVVVLGAEKMPADLEAAFAQRFGVRPVEAYGLTELSPLVSLNVPPSRSGAAELDRRDGTVGRPAPGVSVKVVEPTTFEPLPAGQQGMLLVTGPNLMQGYLDQPDKTAEVIRDGWYITGDLGTIDAEGFIRITGRLSRFSKVGGEMVPHLRVEEELLRLIGTGEEDKLKLVVAAVPDPKRGERLVVLYTTLPLSPAEMTQRLADVGLPNLWLPSLDSYYQVDEIPILGTGKLDLRRVKELALQAGGGTSQSPEVSTTNGA